MSVTESVSISVLAVTVTFIVSRPLLWTQTNLYVPATVKPDMVEVVLVSFEKAVAAGLDDNALHVPLPLAAIVAVLRWQMVWSGPAAGQLSIVTGFDTAAIHPLLIYWAV